MPRDGTGTYNAPESPAVTATPITASGFNATISDLGSALTQSLSRDGQTQPSANLPMNTFRHTNVGNATALNQYAALNQAHLVGEVTAFAGATIPTYWLLCGGQAVSRTTYAALFAAIGTAWGVGDGSTTFNVPDLRGRSLFGRDDMGGTAASRVTNGGSGVNGATLGAVGGNQLLHSHGHAVADTGHSHTASAAANGFHTHTGSTSSDGFHDHGLPGQVVGGGTGIGGGVGQQYAGTQTNGAGSHTHTLNINGDGSHAHTITVDSGTTGVVVQNNGGGGSQNMPPAAVVNYIVYAGA